MNSSSTDDNVIVLRSGAESEMMSGLSGDDVRLIAEAPGLARGDQGTIASPELFVIINLPKRSTGTDANVPLRGVDESAFAIRQGFRVIEGRAFQPGISEVIVGIGAREEFAGLEIGDTIDVGARQWPVVGVFEAGGGIAESEIWVDAKALQDAYRRGNSYQAVYATLEGQGRYPEFKDALTTDPRLKVQRQSEYYEGQTAGLYNLITGLGTLIALIMGLGAIFGALNTMYTAVSSRNREIATLRALGFRSGPVIISVLAESMLLSFVGGLLGAGLAWLAFDGMRTSTLNWSSFSALTFNFNVNAPLLITGIVLAMVIGFFGGLFPAIRAARVPVAHALREL
jgi:putative ABC transport system permease protein